VEGAGCLGFDEDGVMLCRKEKKIITGCHTWRNANGFGTSLGKP